MVMTLRRLALPLLAAALAACASARVAVNRNFDFTKIRRVAVIGFNDYPRREGSGDLVSGAFEQALISAGYEVVERAQVHRIMAEKKFSGAPDARKAKALGKLLGVDALLFGQITDLVESRTDLVNVDVVDDRIDPVYVRKTRRVTQSDGSTSEVSESVIDGYKTTHIVRQEPRSYTTDGRLGVSARLVYVQTGAVLWSGSDSTIAYSFQDAASGLAQEILKAVKPTWPSSQK
jgi:hypothetical protein